ncbi:MAG: hypothetical protein VYD19_01480 [Myxococcota bacterium]|nr:hypothetical protein [Myxococcota bacterium]
MTLPSSLTQWITLSLIVPLALALLAAHLQASLLSGRPFPGAFLLCAVAQVRKKRRLEAPGLLLLRGAILVTIFAQLSGLSCVASRGTVAIAKGPFDADPSWPSPLRVLRAGAHPRWVAAPREVEPVLGDPNIGATLDMIAAEGLSDALIVYPPPRAPMITELGIERGEKDARLIYTRLAADVPQEARPTLQLIKGELLSFSLVSGVDRLWQLELSAEHPAGGGVLSLRLGGRELERHSLCIPLSEITVKEEGWPPALWRDFKRLPLKVLPASTPTLPRWRPVAMNEHVRRSSSGDGKTSERFRWHLSQRHIQQQRWSPFATQGSWQMQTQESGLTFDPSVTLRRPPPWPVPEAPAPRRWRALEGGETLLAAGEVGILNYWHHATGPLRVLGFAPDDAGALRDDIAWPALLLEARDEDRWALSSCAAAPEGQTPRLIGVKGARFEEIRGGGPLKEGSQLQLDTPGLWCFTRGEERACLSAEQDLRGRAAQASLSAEVARAEAPSRGWTVSPVDQRKQSEDLRLYWLSLALLLLSLISAQRAKDHIRRRWVLVSVAATALSLMRAFPLEAPVVLVLDRSPSIDSARQDQLLARWRRALTDRKPKVPLLRIEGNGTSLSTLPVEAPLGKTRAQSDGTDLNLLLRRAASLVGADSRLLLFSDGRWMTPVNTDLPTFPVIDHAAPQSASIDGVERWWRGESLTVDLNLSLPEDPKRRAEGALIIGDERWPLPATGHWWRGQLSRARNAQGRGLRARLLFPDDPRQEDNEAWISLPPRPPLRRCAGDDAGLALLAASGLAPRRLSSPPWSEDLLSSCALIAAEEGIHASNEALRRWVSGGGVLLLSPPTAPKTGARGPLLQGRALGVLDTLSPLSPDPRPIGVAPLRLLILLDRSGSISVEAGGVGLGQLLEGVDSALRLLSPDDEVALISFGGSVEPLLAPTPLSELQTLPVPAASRGSTLIGPALELASRWRSPERQNLILLFSDGGVQDPSSLKPVGTALSMEGVSLLAVISGQSSPRLIELIEAFGAQGARISEEGGDESERLGAALLAHLSTSRPAASPQLRYGALWATQVGGEASPPPWWYRRRWRASVTQLISIGTWPLLAQRRLGFGRVIGSATRLGEDWTLKQTQLAKLLQITPPRPTIQLTLSADERSIFAVGPAEEGPVGVAEVEDRAGWHRQLRWTRLSPRQSRLSLPEGLSPPLRVRSDTLDVPSVTLAPLRERETLSLSLDPERLEELARRSGGIPLSGTPTESEVEALCATRALGERRVNFLWLALLALALEVYRWRSQTAQSGS